MTPLIQRHVGSNLVALATAGSFARGRDGAYSDIEFIGFVKRRPHDERVAITFIHDGLLIDAWFMTRDQYLDIFKNKVRLGGHPWPYVALNALSPVINAPFIEELVRLPLPARSEDFRKTIANLWPQVQEATAKVLTAVSAGNELGLLYLYWQMVERMCVILSLINERPFTTSADIFKESLSFSTLPKSFPSLMLNLVEPRIPSNLAESAAAAFQELENILQERGFRLYADSLDSFVSPQSRRTEIAKRFRFDRIAYRAMACFKLFGLG